MDPVKFLDSGKWKVESFTVETEGREKILKGRNFRELRQNREFLPLTKLCSFYT